MKNLLATIVMALSLPAFGSDVKYLCTTLSAPRAAFENINVLVNRDVEKINVVSYEGDFTLSKGEIGIQSKCPVNANSSDYSMTLSDGSISGMLVLIFPKTAFDEKGSFQMSEIYDYDADGTHCSFSSLTCARQ
ncbi:MAG: hypothetical protein ACXVB1_10935 [Pseudobdellovibrionaceae bacterium]